MQQKRILTALFVFALAIGQNGTAAVHAAQPRPVTSMSLNMFQGSELEAVLGATTFGELVRGVTVTYNEVNASKPAERIAAMAAEISVADPDLVGLQEAALWRTGPINGTATNVVFDFVQMLIDSLNQRGARYIAVAITNNLDAEAPSTLGFDVRLTDRVAVLARADLVLPTTDITNVQTNNYAAAAVFNSPVLGPIRIPDGWAAVDAKVRGQSIRFVTTHLSPLSADVQAAEANELVSKPGTGPYPAVIVGDFNSSPTSGPISGYAVMVRSGFADSWVAIRAGDPGYTCCVTSTTAPDQRIDFAFLRGAVAATAAQIVGVSATDLTPSGLWPSDHAALIVQVNVG